MPQNLPRSLRKFEGTPEDYIELARYMDRNLPGGYKSTKLRKKFGSILDVDLDPSSPWYKPPGPNKESGYFMLPRKMKGGRWTLDRYKDKTTVSNKERLAAEEIPPKVKKDIIELYGEKEFNRFKEWVENGVKNKKDLTNLIETWSDYKYDIGHWRSIRSDEKEFFEKNTKPEDWDWKGRSAHVGLNLDPEQRTRNRSRGNKSDPSSEFLVNAGIPRNWEEAFIYFKDPQGLPDRTGLRLSSRQLQEIGSSKLSGEDLENKLNNATLTIGKSNLRTLGRAGRYFAGPLSVAETTREAVAADARFRQDPSLFNNVLSKVRTLEATTDAAGLLTASTGIGLAATPWLEGGSMVVGGVGDLMEVGSSLFSGTPTDTQIDRIHRQIEDPKKANQEQNNSLSEEDRNIFEAGGGNAAMTKYGWDIKKTMAQGYKNLLLQTPDFN